MDPPTKRPKHSPTTEPYNNNDNFISLSTTNDDEETQASKYGYSDQQATPSSAPREPRAMRPSHNTNRHDPRHARDRPKSKHPLPSGYEPWILVKTKLKRRFVHNPSTGESFWRFPAHVAAGVREFDAVERVREEREKNAAWAEEQLKEMRAGGSSDAKVQEGKESSRRRRSESLQREDEAALLAELAAEAERAEERDVREVVERVEPLKPAGLVVGEGGEESGSEYEVVEVTDSEFEDEGEGGEGAAEQRTRADGDASTSQHHDRPQEQELDSHAPLEFGEDDIAYQLALMNEEQEQDGPPSDEDNAETYASDADEDEHEDEDATAAALFREMLSDHKISPYTPWTTLITPPPTTDNSESILTDPRYTALPTTRARKAVFTAWARDTAAELQAARAAQKPQDPKAEFLAFLQGKASPRLYWPEFKRKFKKEKVMVASERKLGEREKEKLYREFVARLKLPERTREADLVGLLKSIPISEMQGLGSLEELPEKVTGHVHIWSVPEGTRERVVREYLATLPLVSEGDEANGKGAKDGSKRGERQRQEVALEERRRKVEEERRKAEKEERWAKKDLREEEMELRRAMEVGRKGLERQLRDE